MNGIHDMGGMHGMGPVVHEDKEREEHEPVFHEVWEGRCYAINNLVGRSSWNTWNLDARRHGIEVIPPAEYLRMSYYEKWLERIIECLIQLGKITWEELASGRAASPSRSRGAALSAEQAQATMAQRGNFLRPDAPAVARFAAGDPVRARNIHPSGHTRLPRYARGKSGVIDRVRGIFVFPDTNAHFQGEQPQHLYSVKFAARELWGGGAAPRDSVYIDLWDSYLDPA